LYHKVTENYEIHREGNIKCSHKYKLTDVHDIDWDFAYFQCSKCGRLILDTYTQREAKEIANILDKDLLVLNRLHLKGQNCADQKEGGENAS
jgi:hypothetical protein